ncbi:DinB family protein [Salibacterium salarium]|uniref:DinB family protein n=1 Tax=Salibacterium salarium TaxID=284579 RepID=A0A3R9P3A5_9BACI|nr:DinB family protein [Salibacterium salarium]RSL31908.1 DinB family protein [Salibacterium salarium]
MGRIEEYQSTIQSQLDFFIQKGQELREEVVMFKPSREEWSVQEVLAHVEEFPLYFTNELLLVVNDGQQEWGRGFDHVERLAAVNTAFDSNVSDIIKRIGQTKAIVTERLNRINDDDLDQVVAHRNPKFGEKPMTFLVNHFLVDHLDTHQKQVERVLGQYDEYKGDDE